MSEIREVETNMELLEKVLSKENLNNAYKQVYKNKGASGIDGVTVEELFSYIREHQEQVEEWQDMLQENYNKVIPKFINHMKSIKKL